MIPLSPTDQSHLIHDLKIPLNVIMGYIGLLKDSPLDPTQKEDLEGIKKNVLFMVKLIDDLRTLFHEKPLVAEKKPFDGRIFMEEVAASFERSYRAKVECSFPPALPLETDPHILRRIMANLLENGYRHGSPESPLSLKGEIAGESCFFRIHNQTMGLGIPLEGYTPQEKLERRDSSVPTGLGLLVAQKLTELLMGTLQIKSGEREMEVVLSLALSPHRKGDES